MELATGIVDMEITYGRDTNGDSAPDVYQSADVLGTAIGNWRSVKTVRVEMVAATERQYNTGIDNSYTLAGATVTPADARLYRVFSSTFQVRNNL